MWPSPLPVIEYWRYCLTGCMETSSPFTVCRLNIHVSLLVGDFFFLKRTIQLFKAIKLFTDSVRCNRQKMSFLGTSTSLDLHFQVWPLCQNHCPALFLTEQAYGYKITYLKTELKCYITYNIMYTTQQIKQSKAIWRLLYMFYWLNVMKIFTSMSDTESHWSSLFFLFFLKLQCLLTWSWMILNVFVWGWFRLNMHFPQLLTDYSECIHELSHLRSAEKTDFPIWLIIFDLLAWVDHNVLPSSTAVHQAPHG